MMWLFLRLGGPRMIAMITTFWLWHYRAARSMEPIWSERRSAGFFRRSGNVLLGRNVRRAVNILRNNNFLHISQSAIAELPD